MKKFIQIPVLLMICLVGLTACEFNSSTEADTTLDLQGGKALYGAWERSTVLSLGGDAVDSWNLYFTDSNVYFIHELRSEDGWDSLVSGGSSGLEYVVQSGWSSEENHVSFTADPYQVLSLSDQWPVLPTTAEVPYYIADSLPVLSFNGIAYQAYVYSNFDTLAWVNRGVANYRSSDIDSEQVDVFTLQGPYEFTILSIQDNGAAMEMHITDKACYDLHKDQLNRIDSLCDVAVYTQRNRPYFADVVKHVDTLSATAAYFPTGVKGRITGRSPPVVIPIQRGAETW